MKKVVPALAIALMAAVGGSSSAQAAVHIIDFSLGISGTAGGTLAYMPTGTAADTLDQSSQFDFDGTTLIVTQVGPDDNSSGLSDGAVVSLLPKLIDYGTGSGTLPLGTAIANGPIVKSWTAGGDSFVEKLNDVVSIDRTSVNDITVKLSGEVTDTLGIFKGTLATMTLSATQDGGVDTAVSVSLSNFAETSTSTIPEPSTWVMMALGFVGLGYAAVRRSSKDRGALAI